MIIPEVLGVTTAQQTHVFAARERNSRGTKERGNQGSICAGWVLITCLGRAPLCRAVPKRRGGPGFRRSCRGDNKSSFTLWRRDDGLATDVSSATDSWRTKDGSRNGRRPELRQSSPPAIANFIFGRVNRSAAKRIRPANYPAASTCYWIVWRRPTLSAKTKVIHSGTSRLLTLVPVTRPRYRPGRGAVAH